MVIVAGFKGCPLQAICISGRVVVEYNNGRQNVLKWIEVP
jgi:hypothetical protein